ncbi:MAG: site-specific integrase [Deltaproteobacteria bacterium]|nr:site-specific integrase [Deltaproteobacteria bacterium]
MARPIKQRNKWRIRWIDHKGERQSEVFDKLRDAERELRRNEQEAEEIRLRLRQPIILDKTFNDLADYWLSTRALAKRSRKDDESIIRAHLRPAFGPMRLVDIDVAPIDLFSASKGHLSDKTLANHLTLLGTMLGVAVDLRWLSRMPKITKPKVPLFSSDYRYLRNEEEIARFLNAAATEGVLVFTLYAVAIYAGLRAGEIAGLRWRHIDFEKRLITVEASYDGDTKSGSVRRVPLLDPLLPVLTRWQELHPGDLVFTNERGEMIGESARVFQEVLHRVLTVGEFKPITTKTGDEQRYLTFHCLRHTFASLWVARGGDIYMLQRILGHQSQAMTQRYAHLQPELYCEELGRLGSSAPAANDVAATKLRTRQVRSPRSLPQSGRASSASA